MKYNKNDMMDSYTKIFLSLLMIIAYSTGYSQSHIEGCYHHMKGNNLWGCVYIGSDVFEYIEYSNGFPWPVFRADYSWADKHFIRLQSIPMKSIVDNSLQVNQFISGENVDSVNVHVFAPKSQWHGGLNCEILYFLENGDGEWKNVSVPNSVNKFSSLLDSGVMLPSQTKKIVLKIEPNDKRNIPHPAQTYGAYYDSYLYYLSSEVKIDKGAERIRIELPELCGFDFGPYFVNGEYVMVKKNKIIWRGQIFEKVGDSRPVDAPYSVAVSFK